MSIDFFGIGSPGQIADLKKTQQGKQDKKTESSQETDQVQFSSVLQDVGKTQGTTATSQSERAERVAALKAQVAEGSYSPDLQKVASSLLQFIVEDK